MFIFEKMNERLHIRSIIVCRLQLHPGCTYPATFIRTIASIRNSFSRMNQSLHRSMHFSVMIKKRKRVGLRKKILFLFHVRNSTGICPFTDLPTFVAV